MTHNITIRSATTADTAAMHRLAALDETATIFLPALIAEQDGRPVAVMSLADGMVAADPFIRTKSVVELFTLRGQRLAHQPARRGHRALCRRPRGAVAARV
ncbi:MAG: hypothetical protein ACSLFR_15520 [Solirubrobacteraceae bacterium]